MRFEQALWDGSDPTYAPCMIRVKGMCYWQAPKKYIQAGYGLKTPIRLEGRDGDDMHAARAQRCRDLTREMLRWNDSRFVSAVCVTWDDLIKAYLSDEFSPIRDVKGNTRAIYQWLLDRWSQAIGTQVIAAVTQADIRRWQRAMSENHTARAVVENERRALAEIASRVNADPTAYIKRMFTMLRGLVSYGKSIKAPGALEAKSVLEEMRFASPKPRTLAPSSDQIHAIIAKADEAGDAAFALGLSLQWWTAMRAVDIRGQWLAGHDGKPRWGDGLTWDMIDLDTGIMRKIPSKTERRNNQVLTFDLGAMPEIWNRITAIPADQRVGPVIKLDGTPFRVRHWRNLFRKYARAAGVPDEIQLMDTRAGALTHASMSGADKASIQKSAGHKNAATTERYIRDGDSQVARVLTLRRTDRK